MQHAIFTFSEFRELVGVDQEVQQQILALKLGNGHWRIGFGIPAIVELVKYRFHDDAEGIRNRTSWVPRTISGLGDQVQIRPEAWVSMKGKQYVRRPARIQTDDSRPSMGLSMIGGR